MKADTTDAPWSAHTIRLLLDGETRYVATDATGREFEAVATGMTADDMRQAAYEGGPPTMVLDAVQLERAIRDLDDPGIRAAMLLRMRFHAHHLTDHNIQDLLWSHMGEDRPAHVLIKKGIDLIAQDERARGVEVAVEARRKRVCWRCLTRQVRTAGDDCGARCPALVDKAARPKRKSIDDMSLQDLIASQQRGSVPGSEWARKNEVPVGLTIHGAA